jgi:PAS domain S-box-containing protein
MPKSRDLKPAGGRPPASAAVQDLRPSAAAEALLDAVPDALVVIDKDGRIVEANAAAEALFGRPRAALIGLDLGALTSARASGRRPSQPVIRRWARQASASPGREVKVLHRELGCVRAWLRIAAVPGAPDHLLLAFSDLREHRQAEASASLREKHLAHIVESAEDGIVSVDAEQRIAVFNRGAEEMFGYAASEVIGRRLEILLPKRSRAGHREQVAAFGTGPRSARRMGERTEVVGRRKNGEEFAVDASIMRFDLGRGPVFTAVLRDVSERKRLERQLAESERRFRAIFDHTFQFVGLLQPDGTVIEINRTALKQVDVELRDVVGKPLWECPWWRYSPGSAGTVKEAIARAASGQFVRYTVDVQGTNSSRTIDFSLMPVFDDSGQVASIIPEGRDITELTRATAALRLSESRLAKAQRIARLGYFDWNAEDQTTYWSDEIYRILGIPLVETSGFTPSYGALLDRVHPGDREAVQTAIMGALENGRGFDIVHRVLRPDGTERILHAQAEVTCDDAGRPIRLAGMVQDVTEAKRAEMALFAAKEQAEHANRTKSSFLANMSHELRTPLNAVIGFSEIMTMQMFGPLSEAYVAYAKDINESGHHLLNIINDILDMSKIEAGRQQLHESDVSLKNVIAATLRLIAVRAEEAGLHVSVRLPPDIPVLHADERMIKQILLNLLSNAVKFTPSGGRITVLARTAAHDVLELAVADTGIGMAPKDIPTALEPFGQVDSTLSRKFQGTGLGLPLVKALAELHGGTLAIDSALGVGTTVTVRFPASRTRRPAPAPDEPAAASGAGDAAVLCGCAADAAGAVRHRAGCQVVR